MNRDWGGAFWGDDKVDFFSKGVVKSTLLSPKKAQPKKAHKQKIEPNVTCNNMKMMWEGMSLMSGHKGKKGSSSELCSATREFYDELNDFYCRIDTYDFSTERNS